MKFSFMESPILDLTQVRKIYKGKVEALRGVSIEVPRDSIFGLLGPNGAGKSTLVKILTTIIRPTECQGSMLGQPIGHKPTLARVGYLPEHARFPSYLTGEQVIEYAAALSGVPRQRARERTAELLELVGMTDARERLIETYSKGMVQRIGFAQALVNDPELVFLDEPTDGVDPAGRRDMRELLLKLRDEGRTVFVNSHLLGELETVCDSVVILKEGRVVKQGRLDDLTRDSRRFEILTAALIPAELAGKLREAGFTVESRRVAVPGADPAPVQPVLDELRSGGAVITSVRQAQQSLEDLFLESVAGSAASEQGDAA